ncbi:MAG: 2-oxo acid dehydrogenase subunit E2 [Polyangiaceae bacterium]|nr:2-oxo acid dehydrogenase subunit E2 [Polyangiaceae bacterium]
MATYEFKLPDIGEGVTEGEIVSWLVKAGDQVREDQEMVEVMTDKATVTIGAPKAGRVAELRAKEGEVVAVGKVLVVLEVGGAAGASAAPVPATTASAGAPEKPPGEVVASAVGDIRESLPGMGSPRPRPPAPVASADDGYRNEKPLAAPATRKLARELGVPIERVRPTGEGGRVTREDVERFAARGAQAVIPTAPPAPTIAMADTRHEAITVRPEPEAPSVVSAPAAAPVPARPREQRVPIRGLRKRIFENMARSKHTAAHFTYVDECDCTGLVALRDRSKQHAERAGVKLSYLPFIVKAAVAALRQHPALNCLVDDAKQELVLRSSYDIGIAAATDAGLTVPVVRDADRKSVLDVARDIDRLAALARDGKLGKEDLGGSSFTITSLGKLGGLFATPIVNYPEVAILGVHEMKRRPVVRGDQIVPGDVMLLSLSFDHRVIDGHIGAAFARTIIDLLESPDRLLIEMT